MCLEALKCLPLCFKSFEDQILKSNRRFYISKKIFNKFSKFEGGLGVCVGAGCEISTFAQLLIFS